MTSRGPPSPRFHESPPPKVKVAVSDRSAAEQSFKMFARSSSNFKPEKAEVIRIRVKKCDGLMQPEYKKLCVDPQLTSFDILRKLLARAFDIKGQFTTSYLSRDDKNQEVYLSLLSDWDLDAAFQEAADPILRLKVDLRPFEEGLEDWDLMPDPTASRGAGGVPGRGLLQDSAAIIGSLTGTITNQVGRTVNTFSKAMGLWSDDSRPPPPPLKPPMTDREFHHFLDGVGHMIQPGEFRLSVFRGGVEPALRKVVWRHLLNIFPESLSGKERFTYLQSKVQEYYRLREEWRALFLRGHDSEEIRLVANMVKKDVLRTDRSHQYYAGSDDNKNVLSLFNLLVTYAVTHPDVLYCQGMSDLASPLLIVQDDEAHAYICFCGLMRRLKANFTADGEAMTAKFQHLSLLLQHHDPDFHTYLKEQNADDMFFCYRWCLLELKREFPLDEVLLMLEVMWSALPPDPSDLPLADPDYGTSGVLGSPGSPTLPGHSQAYTLLRTRLRAPRSPPEGDTVTPCEDGDPQDFPEVEDTSTAELLRSKAAIIEKALGEETVYSADSADTGGSGDGARSPETSPEHNLQTDRSPQSPQSTETPQTDLPEPGTSAIQISVTAAPETSQSGGGVLSSSPRRPGDIPVTPCVDSARPTTTDVSSCEEAMENLSIDYVRVNQKLPRLPSPGEFGHGNPFLMFTCLTLLVQHRDHIMANRMDYNELAMHYDKMVRRHNVQRVVHQARTLYTNYLKSLTSPENTISSDTPSPDDISV